jgi:hypothetical protein
MIGRARRRKRTLWCAAIDLEKAFDSVEREAIIKTLNDIGLENHLIRTIANIYEQDVCILMKEGRQIGTISKTRRIKQGCKVSPTLFNIIVNESIKKLNRIFPTDTYEKNALFFADDGLIIAGNEKQLRAKINILKRDFAEVGLKMNMEKSEIIVFGKTDQTKIGEIKIVESIKYLGVKIHDKKNIFREYIKEKLVKQKNINSG